MVQLQGLGEVVVVTSGTAVPLSTVQILTPNASLQAPATNTGTIRFGGSNCATLPAGVLRPGESVEITGPKAAGTSDEEFSLSEIYIDADTDGEGVVVGYFARKP